MIKNLIKKSLILSTLIILATFTISSLSQGCWRETTFVWELVFVSGLICMAQLVTNKFKSNYYIIEVSVEYLMVCMIVSLSGLVFGWFHLIYLWQVFIYVTPVYIVGYILELGRTRRDVDFINEQIKQRTERGKKNEQSNDSR